MMFRNLAAMDVEEAIRGNPIDGVVLMVGCDKTTPSLLMGAASVDMPAIVVTGGPMLNGWFRGERVGSGTALWQMSEAIKAGTSRTARATTASLSWIAGTSRCCKSIRSSTAPSAVTSTHRRYFIRRTGRTHPRRQ